MTQHRPGAVHLLRDRAPRAPRGLRALRALRGPRGAALTALTAGVLAVAGCGDGDGDAPDRSGGSVPPAASGTPAASADGSAAPAGSGATSPAPAPARTVTSMTSFQSPTNNIHCYLAPVEGSSPYARCDLEQVEWSEPEPESGCAGAWGGANGRGSVGVGGAEAAVLCVGDTAVDPGSPVLEYGSSITLGPLTCTSRKNGMECANADTGYGFTVSRGAFTPVGPG